MKRPVPSRRVLVSGAVATTALALACGRPAASPEAATHTEVEFDDYPRRPDHDALLVITPYAESTHALWASMRNEVADSMDIVTLEMTDQVTAATLKGSISRITPACVVLVGNRAVRTYRDLQLKDASAPPAVVAMSSFARQLASDLRNTTGVAYEVPAVTSFVALRQVSDRPLHRVGAVYRPEFAEFIKQEAKLAEMEEVELVSKSLDGAVNPRQLRSALRELLVKQKVDALWVPNDNALLTPDTIRAAWLPEAERSRVPVIVGVSSLVNPRLSFGSIAVVPDHAALGVQVANLLYELYDEDWLIDDRDFELPLSVETVVDMKQSDLLRLKAEAAQHIDRQVTKATPASVVL